MQNNKQNKDKYYIQKLLLINQAKEAKKEKITFIKSKILLDLDNIEDKENEIMNNKKQNNIQNKANNI